MIGKYMNNILEIENVSKQYRLGVVGTGTLSHDLNRWFHKLRGKEDPYLKIGDTNDRSSEGTSDYVWALKNVSFNVQEGEVLGIIGKNGAGKSTLLKILSKVTGPTTGSIRAYGRIASLLEVGTGFHPELTGLENIYLNGAILGMSKREIKNKLEEIIEFSGCKRYIQTPVKRYSSGMYVRLAFAVAAHLEPEILVVDEVLAVGDHEFQRRAIGKMKEVSEGGGRTVLFVSHNMDSIKNLCKNTVLMENGTVSEIGPTHKIIEKYLSELYTFQNNFKALREDEKGDSSIYVHNICMIDSMLNETNKVFVNEIIGVRIEFSVLDLQSTPLLNIDLHSADGKYIMSSISTFQVNKGKGKYASTVWIPQDTLNDSYYKISVGIFSENDIGGMHINSNVHFYIKDAITFKVEDSDMSITREFYKREYGALLRMGLNWELQKG